MFQVKTSSTNLLMRNEILNEAREWSGTPYRHQASLKGIGCDCVGLITGVGVAVGVLDITSDQIKAYSNYGRLPNPKRMRELLYQYLDPISKDESDIGDIAWIQWRDGLPMHLAIIGEHGGRRTLIHALGDIGKVTEHGMSQEWEDRTLSYWRYPGIN